MVSYLTNYSRKSIYSYRIRENLICDGVLFKNLLFEEEFNI